MLGDYRRAGAALDAVDDPHLPPETRRVVLSGRLWLWVFGPIGDAAAIATAQDMSLQGPPDEVTFEICHVTATALSEIAGPQHVAPLIKRASRLQDSVAISAPALARARTVHMWWEASRGEGERARRIGQEACDRAETTYSLESLALLAGSAGWLTALTGRIADACRISGSVERVPETDDWFQFRTLAALVHQGNEYLRGSSSPPVAPAEKEHRSGTGPDLGRLFASRAHVLRCERFGQPVDSADVESTLRLLIGNRKHRWTAFFGLEMTSLASGSAIHELLWESSDAGPSTGIVAVSGAAARARLDGDCVALLRCGQELEWAGFDGLALRALADAVRLTKPQTAEGRRARGGLLRALRRWDGAYPPWLDEEETIPTPRQMEIVWRLAQGRTASQVADQMYLSTRTIENHLHRVYRTLQVHGRQELSALLRSAPRPVNWQIGPRE